MFALKLKSKEKLESVLGKKTFAIKCFGCKEVFFPENEVDIYLEEKQPGNIKRLDYLCKEEFSRTCLEKYSGEVQRADNIVVFSCGTGVQTIAGILEKTAVYPGCDTFYLNGFQGLKCQKRDCLQCGECRLNNTGGICPLTACSKSLINGPCGGANEGKCEVNKEMDCGWELIYRGLGALGKKDILKEKRQPRDFSKMIVDHSPTGEDKK